MTIDRGFIIYSKNPKKVNEQNILKDKESIIQNTENYLI